MKDIVLFHPAIDYEDNYPCSWIPFSVLSIASTLPKDKFHVVILDGNKMQDEELYQKLKELDIFIVGISIMTGGGQIKRALFFAKTIRERCPNAYIVFGGPHANVLPEQTAECELVDFVICGPGQMAFRELAEALYDGKRIGDVDGIYYCVDGKIVKPKKLKACIHQLYPYNFNLIDPNIYIRYDATIADKTLNYIASQGCPYSCNFCYECTYDKKYYTMDIANVQKDIQLYSEKYGVEGIKFYDADFFVHMRRAEAIIDTLKEYQLSWAASIHPKDIIRGKSNSTNGLLQKINKSQCKRLLLGMESGNRRVLKDIINKHVTPDELLEVAKKIADYGILGSYTFMVGYPDETVEEQEETFAFIEQLWKLQIPIETKVHIYLPYPGTPLYQRSLELGFIAPDKLEEWSEFNYYKAMTPWTDKDLEQKISQYTHMINKNKG